jgi:hypothetical protein
MFEAEAEAKMKRLIISSSWRPDGDADEEGVGAKKCW